MSKGWKSLTPEFMSVVQTTEMIWNISEPLIPEVVKGLNELIEKKIFTLEVILDIFDYICSKSLNKLELYSKLVTAFMKSRNLIGNNYLFPQTPALQASLILTNTITGEMPEQYTTETSLQEVYKVYQEETIYHALFYDDADEFSKIVDDAELVVDDVRIIDLSARYGSLSCFQFLVEKGAAINDETIENAFIGNNMAIIKMCEKTCQISVKCASNCVENHHNITANYVKERFLVESPWESSLLSYNFQAFFSKLSTCNTIDDSDIYGKTALMATCEYGFMFICDFLVANGSNIEHKDERQCTATIFAAANDRVDVLKYLISHKSDIEARTNIGFTPLIIASQQNCLESVKILIGSGARIDATDDSGATALIIATQNGSFEVAQYLVEMKSDVNHQDNEGATALMYSILQGYSDIFQILVENGADPTIENKQGFNSIRICEECGLQDFIDILNEK